MPREKLIQDNVKRDIKFVFREFRNQELLRDLVEERINNEFDFRTREVTALEVVNPSAIIEGYEDLIWGVYLGELSPLFIVGASYESEAVDLVVDHCEENDWMSFFVDPIDDEELYNELDEAEVLSFYGNHSLAIAAPWPHVELICQL